MSFFIIYGHVKRTIEHYWASPMVITYPNCVMSFETVVWRGKKSKQKIGIEEQINLFKYAPISKTLSLDDGVKI